jgi:hypothetical protein
MILWYAFSQFSILSTRELIIAELEPVLEDERHDNFNFDILQSRSRSFGVGTYVSATDEGFPVGFGCRGAIHRRVHLGSRVQ